MPVRDRKKNTHEQANTHLYNQRGVNKFLHVTNNFFFNIRKLNKFLHELHLRFVCKTQIGKKISS